MVVFSVHMYKIPFSRALCTFCFRTNLSLPWMIASHNFDARREEIAVLDFNYGLNRCLTCMPSRFLRKTFL